MNQNKMTEQGPLLDKTGNLAHAGYATSLVREYNRSHIRAPRIRIKEWDYYLISDGRRALALTIDDNGYMGLDSISWLNLETGWEHTSSPMCPFPMGRRKMPVTSVKGDCHAKGRRYELHFLNDGQTRRLYGGMDHFEGHRAIAFDIKLTDIPQDSMVIATPFDKKGHFYYNQKINCLRAEGTVVFGGESWRFVPDEAFAVLDWGRGVWTYRNTWYWASASGEQAGRRIGFNLGYGFGNTSAATENMVFVNGIASKLEHVTFHIPQKDGKDDYLSPWRFSSTDGRFEMCFTPVLDRASNTDVWLIGSNQHQVFGKFTGSFITDDGESITVTDFPGFAEKVTNKW